MFFSVAVVSCALSLLSSAHALALAERQSDDCGFVCPKVDANGNALLVETGYPSSFACTYSAASENPCVYDSLSGALTGSDPDGGCPQQASTQCSARRRRDDDYDSEDWKPTPSWTPEPYPTWSEPPTPPSSWSEPTQPWSKPPHSWSEPTPTPYPTWTPEPQPPKKEPCKYTCPQKDLVKSALTDAAIRGPYLFCRYPTSTCKQCGFCKYSTKTGVLLEDNDDGNCPKNAPLALPWDRRNV